jgi:hypothetical protein
MRQATVKPYESFAFTLEELTRLEQSVTGIATRKRAQPKMYGYISSLHPLKLVDEVYTEEELVSRFPSVVSASIPRMVKPQLRS